MNGSLGTKIFKNLSGDSAIWLIVAILSILSLLSVYSASGRMAFIENGSSTEVYLGKQLVFICFGLFLMYLSFKIHYSRYSILAPMLLVIAVILLIYTQLFGVEINDARRWIQIPFINKTFQTSDFAKLALILYIARAIAKNQDNIKDFNSAFLPIIFPIVLVCGLIAPSNLSTAGLLFFTCLIMMFIGRIHIKYIFFLIMMGVVMLALLILIGQVFPDVVRVDTWVNRINEFYGSEQYDSANLYQVIQAKIAIANGGIFGLGPGLSDQRNFLPSAYSDFIYAIICEEYGLVGGISLIILYFWLFLRCTSIVTKSPKTFGAILAMGLCLNIVIQAYTNIAVSLHLVPTTGQTLPMISWGGTSLIFTCIMFGIILSVSKYIEKYSGQLATVKNKE